MTASVLIVIVMPAFFQALDTKMTVQPQTNKWFSSASHFSVFIAI